MAVVRGLRLGQTRPTKVVRVSPMSIRSFRSFLGSSVISGEWSSYLQEEVLMVTVSVRHSFDDLDLVVEALDQACI